MPRPLTSLVAREPRRNEEGALKTVASARPIRSNTDKLSDGKAGGLKFSVGWNLWSRS
jgi:hypothetical protein